MTVIRPADANETAQAWRVALLNTNGPTVLALTRQNLPIYDRAADGLGAAESLAQGGYVFYEPAGGEPNVVMIATGSEVDIAYNGAKLLADEGIAARVVSLPCGNSLPPRTRATVTKCCHPDVPRVSIEAATTFGWARWVNDGISIGIDHFGASGPYQKLYAEFGLTAENVAAQARSVLGK